MTFTVGKSKKKKQTKDVESRLASKGAKMNALEVVEVSAGITARLTLFVAAGLADHKLVNLAGNWFDDEQMKATAAGLVQDVADRLFIIAGWVQQKQKELK